MAAMTRFSPEARNCCASGPRSVIRPRPQIPGADCERAGFRADGHGCDGTPHQDHEFALPPEPVLVTSAGMRPPGSCGAKPLPLFSAWWSRPRGCPKQRPVSTELSPNFGDKLRPRRRTSRCPAVFSDHPFSGRISASARSIASNTWLGRNGFCKKPKEDTASARSMVWSSQMPERKIEGTPNRSRRS